MAKQTTSARSRGHQGNNRGALVAFVLAMIISGALFIPTAVLVMIGMLPAIVAFLIDDDRKKSLSMTVALMNGAGVIPFVIELWHKGQTLHETFAIIQQPMVWLFMYGGAAMGWLIIYSVPAVVQALLTHRASVRIADIDKRHADLVVQWGEDVKANKHHHK